MKTDKVANLISICVLIFTIAFVIWGTSDTIKLSNIFEKIGTLNITISIGYGTLLAAVAALSSHNTKQDNSIKTHLMTSVRITIYYILLNEMIFFISFLMDQSISTFPARILIGLLLTILILYSNFILRICAKLIY